MVRAGSSLSQIKLQFMHITHGGSDYKTAKIQHQRTLGSNYPNQTRKGYLGGFSHGSSEP